MHFLFLGTSGAIPSATRDTTSIVFVGDAGAILVDCGGSPFQKLGRAGVDPLSLTHVVITHMHPDHAYGLPALVQGSMLARRQAPLVVACRAEHVEPVRRLLEIFDLWQRPGAFAVELAPVSPDVGARALASGALTVTTTPNEHGKMPNFALRVDAVGHASVAYSSDTAPCDAVVALASGADTLIHEATFPERDRGRFGSHSTAQEAGEVAARAGVRRLILTHIDAEYHDDLDELVTDARRRFSGVVEIAHELVPYPL